MKELTRWKTSWNRTNGYGGTFDRPTPADKPIVEMSTAREWCDAMAGEFGISLAELYRNVDEPPDCWVALHGQVLGLELTELMEQEHKRRAANGETPYSGQLFWDTQWSGERLVQKLREIIERKGNRYQSVGKRIDALVIHSDEPWLTSDQAGRWLSDIRIERHPNIGSAFLLFTYEPGRDVEHWPVLWLYGNLASIEPPSRQ